MIVATHMGMYMPALRPDWQKLPEGTPELQIRARRRVDLLNLREFAQQYDLEIGAVFALKNTDYQYRAYCTRVTWGQVLSLLAEDIDYTKFKNTPEKYHGDKKLTMCYESMWRAIFNAFPKGSIYDKVWKTTPARRDYTSRTSPLYDEVTQFTRIDELSPRAKQQLWDMSEVERRTRRKDQENREDEEPEVSVYDQYPDLADDLAKLDAIIDVTPSYMGVGPLEQPGGTLDHSLCTHAKTKSARRRCRKDYWK